MQIDYKERHIKTEKRFYLRMDKTKTFLLTLVIVGFGSFFLYIQYWSIKHSNKIDLVIWTIIVGILFVSQTFAGHYFFEYERKKYIKKTN
jgi:fatty acid desaturase